MFNFLFWLGTLLLMPILYTVKINIYNRLSYGDYVKIKKGFYKGYLGQVRSYVLPVYLVRLLGEDPNHRPLLMPGGLQWVLYRNLEKLDIEVEKVKEDFWNKIKPQQNESKPGKWL